MKPEDLKHAFGRAPASFRREVDEVLKGLGESAAPKRGRLTLIAPLTAVLCVLLLAGTALAAGRLRLFDRQEVGAPLPEAETLVRTNVADAAGDLVRLELEEALFDGRRALFLLRLTPTDPEHYSLLKREEDTSPTSESTETCVVVSHDGGAVFRCKVMVDAVVDSAALEDTELQEDGSLLIWGQLYITGPLADTLRCEASAILYAELDGEVISTANALFELTRSSEERTARLEPLADGSTAGFEILSGSLSTTPVLGLFTMDYTCEREISFTYRDETGAELPIGAHFVTPYEHGDAPHWEYRWETNPFLKFPETITIEGHREGVSYGSVTCRVVEE